MEVIIHRTSRRVELPSGGKSLALTANCQVKAV
jgi:hypothetical protein